jgi:16S rRNA (guanine966-N2)-methyltransferase
VSPAKRRPAPRPRRKASDASAPGRGTLRVVAGTLGGRLLQAPPGTDTRPTSARVREAVFNALDSLGAIDGARVLDAYAGSGALGIEALSRGAAHATFTEVDAASRAVVAANVAALDLDQRATVTGADGARTAASAGPFDLVLLDPPYAFDGWAALLDAVVPGLSPDAVVVLESDREVPLPATLTAVRAKRYGSTVVLFASPTGAPS